MNLYAEIREEILAALARMGEAGRLPEGLETDQITVEPPRDAAHGEMTTNAAMVLAKPAGQPAREIARALSEELAGRGDITQADVAGPGFVNLRLDPDVWQKVCRAALRDGADFGRSNLGAGRRVNVEFVSAYPSAPLQIAHLRGAVFGDALARLLEFTGHDVTREYYVNDGGAQGDVLARSVYLRYLEAHGADVEFPDGTYPGDYLKPLGQALKDRVGAAFLDRDEADWLAEVRAFALERMMDAIRADLASLGVKMDRYFPESALLTSGRIEAALEALHAKGLIYEGVLEPAGGTPPAGWTPRRQTLFRSTAHGDDQDRPVQKSDGSWAYFAPDIAYHYDKLQRGFDALVDVMGMDHGGYVKRLKAVVSALSDGKVPLDVRLLQMTRLSRDGKPLAPSDRPGAVLEGQQIVAEVGADQMRFALLARRTDSLLELDLERLRDQSRDNPAFWVQYAHARATALRQDNADLADATGDGAVAVMRKLAEWPMLVDRAARLREPQRIALYLCDLADVFHDYRQAHTGQASAKSALAGPVAIVIAAGLGILGINPAQQMR